MNYDLLKEMYEIIERRRVEQEEGSYTAFLFNEGLDKILKKLGEEATETIIAAKSLEAIRNAGNNNIEVEKAKEALEGEAGDVLYHLVVLLDYLGIEVGELEDLMRERMKVRRNLKDYSARRDL